MSGPRVKFDPATGEPLFDPQTGDPIFEDAPAPEPERPGNPIFRTASRVERDGIGGAALKGVLGVADVLNTPTAALATLRGQNMGDENPYFWKPEIEKLKVDTRGEQKANDDWQAMRMKAMQESGTAIPDFAWQASPSAVNTWLETAGQMASDPMLGLGKLAKFTKGLGSKIKNQGARVVESVIKPLDAAKGEGFDVENLFKHDLTGSSLRPAKWMEQSQEKLKAFRKVEGEKLGKALKGSGAMFDGKAELDKVAADIATEVKIGNLDPAGAQRALETYTARIQAVTDPKTGMIPAEALNNIKRRAQKDARAMYKAANLGTDAHATEKEIFAQKLGHNIRGTLEDAIPEVKAPNQALAETKPFRRATQKAADRLAKNDGISLKGSILASGIGAAMGAPLGPVGAGAGAAIVPGAVYVADKALKNPAVGTAMYKAGAGLERLGAAGDRILNMPIGRKAPKGMAPEVAADLEAMRAPLDMNPPAPPAGRKVFPQPNVRRPLAKPAIEPARIDTKGALEQAITTEEARAAAAAKLAERQAKMQREMIVLSGQAPPAPPQGSADRFAAVADMVPPPQATQTDENLFRAIQEHNQGLQIDAARAKAAEELAVPAEEKIKRILSRPALSPLPPRKPTGPAIAPNAPPFMEPPKFQEVFDNAGRRPLELKPSELREKLGIAGPRKRVITPVSLEMAQARRNKATKYLTETLGREPLPGEVYDLIEKIGDGPLPVVPPKVKLEREFKGRRDQRHLEFINAAVRGDVVDLPTKPIRASEAPQTFSLQGANFRRIRGQWDNLITYADDQGRKYEFNPKDWIHMDLQEGEVPF